jgi:hypothetical protein
VRAQRCVSEDRAVGARARRRTAPGGALYELQLADRENEPVHTPWDAWGNRIDHIEVSPLWKQAARLAAEHGLVAAGYDRARGAHARVEQFARVHVLGPSLDVYTCPLAMTDGAARTLLASGNAALIERALPRLSLDRSRDRVDLGPVDDRAHRRLGRRAVRDRRAPGRRRLAC